MTLLRFIFLFLLLHLSNQFFLDLLGNFSLGYYFTYFNFEDQTMKLSVETGVPYLASPCNYSLNISQYHKKFSIPAGSKNFSNFIYQTLDNSSINGIILNATTSFGNDTYVGCVQKEYGIYYESETDGILGLKNENEFSILNFLTARQLINEPIFGLCLSSNNNGYLALGYVNDTFHYDNFTHIKAVDNSFSINVTSVGFINYDNVVSRSYIGIIDSGVTFTYFPEKEYKKIVEVLDTVCKYSNSNCSKSTDFEEYETCFAFGKVFSAINLTGIFPDLVISMANREFRWIPKNYLSIIQRDSETFACLNFMSTQATKYIFGVSSIRGYDIVFNYTDHSLGFAKANCNVKGGDDWYPNVFGKVYSRDILTNEKGKIEEREKEIKNKESELKEKEEELIKRENETRIKEEDIKKRENETRRKEDDLKRKEDDIRKRENEIRRKEDDLKKGEKTEEWEKEKQEIKELIKDLKLSLEEAKKNSYAGEDGRTVFQKEKDYKDIIIICFTGVILVLLIILTLCAIQHIKLKRREYHYLKEESSMGVSKTKPTETI